MSRPLAGSHKSSYTTDKSNAALQGARLRRKTAGKEANGQMKRPLILAHRGFSEQYPENSPLAFQMTVDRTEADGFESDVHMTRDGVLVIIHDDTVDRTTNGTGFVRDHTYQELLELDIGVWKSPAFAGQHIWTLDQLLDFCRETGRLLNLELKNDFFFYEGLEQRVIDAVTSRQMQEQVFVSSFNHLSMQRFKTLCPEIRTGLLYDKPLLHMDRYLDGSNADCIHPRYRLLQNLPELTDLFHERGMEIHTWTVNEEADMRDMIARGADGIITNRPDRLCRVAEDLCC